MISRTGHTKSFRERSLSNALIVQGHPSLIVEQIAARHGGDLIFTYSRYQVAAPGLQAAAPRSDVQQVPAGDITPDWLTERFAELGPNQEMAWHSWAECKGMGFHIPMIDFIDRPPDSALGDVSRTVATEMNLRGQFIFFETGRSLHAYFPELILESAWPKYLGQLLILNESDRTPLVDTRWVGHALARGFTALRWSHNTNRYRTLPHLVSVPECRALSQSRHS